jgi:hypothetical protein
MTNKTTGQGSADFRPALNEIGVSKCPVCRREVMVFLTKTNRPFLNCSFCSARVFYNGRESMRLLQQKMRAITERKGR